MTPDSPASTPPEPSTSPEASRKLRILVVDDEDVTRAGLARILKGHDVEIDQASDGAQAWSMASSASPPYNLVLSDYMMPGMNGRDLLVKLVRDCHLTKVIVITGKGSIDAAVECMKLGAYDYIQKPFDIVLIRAAVDRALRESRLAQENVQLRKKLSLQGRGRSTLVWEDPAMDQVVELAQRLAQTDEPILVEGESGTGKELMARTIHEFSRRKGKSFMAVNCGAFTEDLLVGELFGHEKGSFTGADQTKPGIFEATAGGTLLLDEIGELPLSMQVRFLRVLEEKEVLRVGGRKPIGVDFRLVGATNRDLQAFSDQGHFRQDLLYRLRVHYLRLPALRERPKDIPVLFEHYCDALVADGRARVLGLTAAAARVMQEYRWPGNVREMQSIVSQLSVVAGGRIADVKDLPPQLRPLPVAYPVAPFSSAPTATPPIEGARPGESLEALKLEHIRSALVESQGNRTVAARNLGISRVSLHRFLVRHPDLNDVGRTGRIRSAELPGALRPHQPGEEASRSDELGEGDESPDLDQDSEDDQEPT